MNFKEIKEIKEISYFVFDIQIFYLYLHPKFHG